MANPSLTLVLSTPNRLVYLFEPGDSAATSLFAKRTKAELLADSAASQAAPSAIAAAVNSWPTLSAAQQDSDAVLQAIAPGTQHAVGAAPTAAQAKAYVGIPSVGWRLWANVLGNPDVAASFVKDAAPGAAGDIAFAVGGPNSVLGAIVELTVVHTVIG